MAKKTIFDVKGTRWFDRRYGNTYHRVYVDKYDSKGKKIWSKESPIEYGYDDAYTQTAEKLMFPKVKDSKDRRKKWVKLRDSGKLEYSAIDVDRKRDL